MGSVQGVTDGNGREEGRYEYDAFGEPYLGDFGNGIGLGYTGKPYDLVTGMYDYRYRDYRAENGRFTTEDPIRDGANWFVYVNNDPVNWIDLWGLNAYVYVWEAGGKTNVDIFIPINYVGEGATPEVIDKFNKAIEEYWSGEMGKYNVMYKQLLLTIEAWDS
jgi:RHS repeat-associated protein